MTTGDKFASGSFQGPGAVPPIQMAAEGDKFASGSFQGPGAVPPIQMMNVEVQQGQAGVDIDQNETPKRISIPGKFVEVRS